MIFNTILLILTITTSRAREIALTFDDCPRRTGTLMNGMERAKKLTEQLKKAGVQQVAFFCNSPTRHPDGIERLKFFADQGHLIANHSATHPSLNDTPADLYAKDIDQAHAELKDLPGFRKWFRYPYLREGETPEKINAIRSHLQNIGYRNGYVTVDNADWYMDDIFGKAVAAGKKFDQPKLCSAYKRIMANEADFYDNMSVKALGRSVKHVLLLHETDLNALCIADLVAELRKRRWTVISPDDAYTDPSA